MHECNREKVRVSVVTYPARELREVRVPATMGMELCRCVPVREAGLDQGDGLCVARPGWGPFPFSGPVLCALQHPRFIPPGQRTPCAWGSRECWSWCAEEACEYVRFCWLCKSDKFVTPTMILESWCLEQEGGRKPFTI